MPVQNPSKPKDVKAKGLDNGNDTLAKLQQWYDSFEEATSDARSLAERDRDYYDGNQWTDDEITELQRRGQPVITINRISRKINFILGAEIRQRVDPKALPRTVAHEDAATAATDALRYIDDSQSFDKVRSKVYENVLIEGYGGAVVEAEKVVSFGQDGRPIEDVEVKIRCVPWDRIFYDPSSREKDFSDAKFLGVVTWMDVEDAVAIYPDKQDVIEAALNSSTTTSDVSDTLGDRPRKWADEKRKRVKIVEIYWRGPDWNYAHFCGGGWLIEPAPTGYLDELRRDECPLILTSAFVDRENSRYGVIRHMISPQDEINKRRSKALYLLSVRQIIAERGAVQNVDEARQELSRPDGYVEVVGGSRFEPMPNSDFAQGQFSLLAEAKGEIDMTGPSGHAQIGEVSGMSGRAILAQQNAASQELEPLQDAIRDWTKRVYEACWHRVRQFWRSEKWLRIRDDEERNGYRFVGLNVPMTRAQRLQELLGKGTPLPSAIGMLGDVSIAQAANQLLSQSQQQLQMTMQQGAQIDPNMVIAATLQQLMQMPQMQQIVTCNDIELLDVDIILEQAPDTAVVEQEEFEQLSQLAQSGIPIPPDVLIEASQLRNKRKLLEMLRNANQVNPEQAKISQLQGAEIEATIAKTQAQAVEYQARAAKVAAEAQGFGAKVGLDQARAAKAVAEAGEIAGGRGTNGLGGGYR